MGQNQPESDFLGPPEVVVIIIIIVIIRGYRNSTKNYLNLGNALPTILNVIKV
jgi:hypothetical protein